MFLFRADLYCITLIEYMTVEKTFLDYINLFSPNSYRYPLLPNEYKYFLEIYSKNTLALTLD